MIHILNSKPTHALLLNTLSHTHFKTLKLLKKKSFVKTSLKNPTCFGHYCMTILRSRPLYLVHYHFSAFLLRHLPIRYVAVCRLCACVRCSCLWIVWSFMTRQPTDRYTGHRHTIDTYSHTPNNANNEANKRRSGNALSTKDDPWGWSYNNDRNM
jgi:hypothetical protein